MERDSELESLVDEEMEQRPHSGPSVDGISSSLPTTGDADDMTTTGDTDELSSEFVSEGTEEGTSSASISPVPLMHGIVIFESIGNDSNQFGIIECTTPFHPNRIRFNVRDVTGNYSLLVDDAVTFIVRRSGVNRQHVNATAISLIARRNARGVVTGFSEDGSVSFELIGLNFELSAPSSNAATYPDPLQLGDEITCRLQRNAALFEIFNVEKLPRHTIRPELAVSTLFMGVVVKPIITMFLPINADYYGLISIFPGYTERVKFGRLSLQHFEDELVVGDKVTFGIAAYFRGDRIAFNVVAI